MNKKSKIALAILTCLGMAACGGSSSEKAKEETPKKNSAPVITHAKTNVLEKEIYHTACNWLALCKSLFTTQLFSISVKGSLLLVYAVIM